jgi:hypothetical protein
MESGLDLVCLSDSPGLQAYYVFTVIWYSVTFSAATTVRPGSIWQGGGLVAVALGAQVMLYVVAVASWILQVIFCPRFRHCPSSFLLSGFLICFFAKNKKVKDGGSTFPMIDATTACEVQRPPKSSHISVVEYAAVSPVGVDAFCDSERLARAKVKMSARLRNIAVGVAWDESGFVGD